MKKIPTLFERKFADHKVVGITPNVTPGCEDALEEGKCVATVKWDGSCCAIVGKNRGFYKRYDAKKGKTPPEGAIPCQDEPDPVTGHWPHWVKVSDTDPADMWFREALNNTPEEDMEVSGTYEAIGPHFQGNPYELEQDILVLHGARKIEGLELSFEGIREYLRTHEIEGIVFWEGNQPLCKIKRSDFGYEWPVKKSERREPEEEVTKFVGACRYCGQTIAAARYPSQEAADIDATYNCKCDKATRARELEEMIDKAKDNIDQVFGWGAGNNGFTQLDPFIVEDLKEKAEACGRGAIRSCTIVLNNGEIARVKAGTKEVKVKRSKTISAEL